MCTMCKKTNKEGREILNRFAKKLNIVERICRKCQQGESCDRPNCSSPEKFMIENNNESLLFCACYADFMCEEPGCSHFKETIHKDVGNLRVNIIRRNGILPKLTKFCPLCSSKKNE